MGFRPGDTDEALLEAWRDRGDREALAALLERLTPFVLSLARSVARAAAEDVMQDAFVHLIERADAYRPGGRVRPWLARVVINAAVSRARSEASRKRREVSAAPPPAREAAGAGRGALETGEGRQALAAALDSLAPEHRIPLALHYEHGLTHAEVAESLRVTRRAAGKRIDAALARLRRAMERAGFAGAAAAALGDALARLPAAAATPAAQARVTALLSGAKAAGSGAAAAAGAAKAALALKIAAGVLAAGAIAGGSVLAVRALRGRGPGPAGPVPRGPAVVYDDRFAAATLDPFWGAREPASCAATGDGLLVRIPRGVGTGAAGIRSRPVELGAGALEVLVEHSRYGGNSSWRRNGVELLDGTGRTVCALERVVRGRGAYRFSAGEGPPEEIPLGSGVGRIFALRVDRAGRASLLSRGRELAKGQARGGVRAVAVRIFMEMGEGTYFTWGIDRVAVRRLEARPEDPGQGGER